MGRSYAAPRKGNAPSGLAGGAQEKHFKRQVNSNTITTLKQPLVGTYLIAYLKNYRRELIPFSDDPHVSCLIIAGTFILNEKEKL